VRSATDPAFAVGLHRGAAFSLVQQQCRCRCKTLAVSALLDGALPPPPPPPPNNALFACVTWCKKKVEKHIMGTITHRHLRQLRPLPASHEVPPCQSSCLQALNRCPSKFDSACTTGTGRYTCTRRRRTCLESRS
jgi:hypothetical protein